MINVNYDLFHIKNKKIQKCIISEKNYTYQTLLGLINKYLRKSDLVCDFGCGVGVIDLYIALKKNNNVLGIDVSNRAINLAKSSAKTLGIRNVDFQCHDLNKFQIKSKFDFIICSEVLEHLADDKTFIKGLESCLSKDGFIILSFPSTSSPLYRLGLLKNFDKSVGHLRRYNKKLVLELIRDVNLKIEELIEVEGILRNSFYTFKYLGWIVRFIRWPISLMVNFLDNIFGKLFGFSNIYVILRHK